MLEMEDDEFLAQLAAAEAEALASASAAKRLKVTHPTPTPPPAGGAYLEALKGSKGNLFTKQSASTTTNYNNSSNYNSYNINSNNNGYSNVGLSDGGSVTGTGSCFKCGKLGHWSRDCDAKGDGDVVEKQCPCGVGVCNVLTAKTEKNCGRKFYKCPIRQESGGCGFFEWCDNGSGPETVLKASNPSAPELSCPCGAGSCSVLTAKTEKNLGQQFYKCPANQGGCGFFKWCREVTATDGNLSSIYTSPTSQNASSMINNSYNSSNSSCYKCGQDGHWAKDCHQSSSYTSSTYQSTVSMSNKSNNSSNSSCYKCGQDGHWAKDCNQSSSNTSSTYQSTIRMSNKSNNPSNSSCYKCGNDGHWARDCTQSSSNDPSNRTVKTASSGSCFKCGNSGHWAKDCSSTLDTKARYGQ